ncbi:dihydrofolate reductase family protein [Streptomyces sp. NPDC053367]|uniref:dihydrofolate reductase family protein n=1 Tax=Streptomyces sp. NPDC053367 TaxID=3365700 RepID=UPI0037D1514E
MGRLVSQIFLSLDGVHQAPGGPEEDTRDGFEQGGWTVPYADDESGAFITDLFTRPAAFLLGRHTYDIFASYWPKITDPADPIAGPLNRLPKYVVSSTLRDDPGWAGTTVLRGDLAKEVASLKERTDGEIQIHGSAALVASLLDLGLIDTLHLHTFPVVLGAGRRLFREGAVPTAFRRTSGRVTSSGVSIQTYDRAGTPEYGSFPQPGEA